MFPKKFMIGVGGGRAEVFTSKRSYLKWAVSTKDGWKSLMLLPVLALVWLRIRKDYDKNKNELAAMRDYYAKKYR